MDFFTVPALTFGMIHCLFVISHDRRRLLHFGITRHPTSAWVSHQLRETFPYDSASKYLIFDRGSNFNVEVVSTIKSFGSSQNGPASAARGRMASRSVSSEAVAGTCWIT